MNPALRAVLLGGVRPALDLNFMTGAVPGGLTASGGTNGARRTASGFVAATTPRMDYDRGLVMESARANLPLNSLIDGTNLATQSVTVTNVAHTLSFYGTGTVTLSGTSTAGPLVGSATGKSTLTFTPTAGSLTLTVSGTVQYAMLEIGSNATSFTPTGGASVTRAADSVSVADANLTAWYQPEGTYLVEIVAGYANATGRVLVLDNGSAGLLTNGINLDLASGGVRTEGFTGGVQQWGFTGGAVAADAVSKIALAVGTNSIAVALNGIILGSDSAATLPSTGISTMGVGHWNGSSQLNGHVQRVRFYRKRLPDSTLQRLTA